MNRVDAQRTACSERWEEAPRFRQFTLRDFESLPQIQALTPEQRFDIQVVAQVLPFKVNQYVVDHLIDWGNIPEDPMFQLTFPQRDMLSKEHYTQVADALKRGDQDGLKEIVNRIRLELNPHPAGQLQLNVPTYRDEPLAGVQHKYNETALFFPSSGQTCHSYCTFCFRWAQFVGMEDLRFASREAETFAQYLREHPEITDVLFTGGDPMVMKTRVFERYLQPLLDPDLEHVQTIRIGTKSISYWPYRYVTDEDADDLLRLIERLVEGGKNVAIMAHCNHWVEIETPIARKAIRRLRDAGAVIRTQSPLVRHINDSPEVWAKMWRNQVRLGMVPYYMFVERDTGPRDYFGVPLERAWNIYRDAIKQVSGLARTARGPSMSATPGKVEVQGIAEVAGQKVFVLRMIQARNPEWVQRPFFAEYDPKATWLDQLRPAFGERSFFFETEEYAENGSLQSRALKMSV